MFTNVMITLDGSKLAERALEFALPLARIHGARLHLLHVANRNEPLDSPYPVNRDWDSILEEKAAYLRGVVEHLPHSDHGVEWHLVEGEVAKTILAQLEEYKVDLLVMTSHGLTGLSRLVLGSVAEEVARRARCPVMFVGKECLR